MDVKELFQAPGSDFTAEVTPVLFDEDWRKDGRKRTVSSGLHEMASQEQEEQDRPVNADL